MSINNTYRVEMLDINKHFGGIQALKDVTLQIKSGEVHALMGENGAGKSTIMKILSGAEKKDSGEIKIDGEIVEINNTKDGKNSGVSIIYQEFSLCPDLTVAENIFLDYLTEGKKIIHWKKLKSDSDNLLDELGFSGQIDSNKKVGTLSVAYQQVTEICKALSKQSKILIFDEPTAVLTTNEISQLFKLMKSIKQRGVSIVYISHRIDEIFEIADRATVLKDGEFVKTIEIQDIKKTELVNLMIGRDLKDMYPKRNIEIGEEIFSAENINMGNKVADFNIKLRAGEVVGINGMVGAGRTEAMNAIFGSEKKDRGKIILMGNEIDIRNPADAVKSGIGMLQEDRKANGVLLNLSIKINITVSIIKKITGFLNVLNRKREIKIVNDIVDQLRIKISHIENPVSSLSGGNQQKVSLAKWLASECKVLILDEPTRGVDVGAKVEIYKLINELAEKGLGIIIISSEMQEIIGICDRTLIMREGKVLGEIPKENMSEENFINMITGVN